MRRRVVAGLVDAVVLWQEISFFRRRASWATDGKSQLALPYCTVSASVAQRLVHFFPCGDRPCGGSMIDDRGLFLLGRSLRRSLFDE
jgi:hypothetical protein